MNTKDFIRPGVPLTPESQVRHGMAATIPPETLVTDVARAVGNGLLVTAPDTNIQAPTSKLQRRSKHQQPKIRRKRSAIWIFVLGLFWSLVLGSWCFQILAA